MESSHQFQQLTAYHFPFETPYWKWKMQAFMATGDYDSINYISRQMMLEDTLQALPYYCNGLAYYLELKYDAGLPFLKKAKAKMHSPDDLLEGLVLLGEGQKVKALTHINRYIERHPFDSIAVYYRSTIYSFLQDTKHGFENALVIVLTLPL